MSEHSSHTNIQVATNGGVCQNGTCSFVRIGVPSPSPSTAPKRAKEDQQAASAPASASAAAPEVARVVVNGKDVEVLAFRDGDKISITVTGAVDKLEIRGNNVTVEATSVNNLATTGTGVNINASNVGSIGRTTARVSSTRSGTAGARTQEVRIGHQVVSFQSADGTSSNCNTQ